MHTKLRDRDGADARSGPTVAEGGQERLAPNISRVFVCSDFLMTNGREQWSNLRWLNDILRRPVERATSLELKILHLPDHANAGTTLDRSRFFALSEIDLDPSAIQFWYDEKKISQSALEYITGLEIGPESLIIGYELSEQTKTVLRRIGAVYIDMWLHPIRFYDDILFAFQSNHPQIHLGLTQFAVDESQFWLYADRLRVQTFKGWHRVEAKIAENSALFVGQTLNDKSVCRDGKMLTLLDFKEEFEELGSQYERVYYSRHPYLKSGDEDILRYIDSCPFAELTNEQTYRLLASPRLDHVTSISSSSVFEAHYFGKDVRYLHKPIFDFRQPERLDQFSTICQDFVSPHFWGSILSSVLDVRDCPVIEFRDRKDKIRDMLGFYWSYGQIDKVEAARERLRSVATQVQSQAKARVDAPAPGRSLTTPVASEMTESDPTSFIPEPDRVEPLMKAIGQANVVSFDVFETLIERPLQRPDDIFLMMGETIKERLGSRLSNFAKARKESRALAAPLVDGEEVDLESRYRALARHHGLSEADADWMLSVELEFERRLCRARPLGQKAFKKARKRGRRIILISDTFFSKAFLEELLTLAGYEGWDALYASSDVGLTKRTGRLFEHVIKAEACPPGDILHVGDNPVSDIEQAKRLGLRTFFVDQTTRIARRVSPLGQAFDSIESARTRSAIQGLVSRSIGSDVVTPRRGYSQGEPYQFGYSVLGPMFFGLARWLIHAATRDGVQDLFFLSRDGDIIKRCYDALAASSPQAPRSHYILASRRAVRTANLHSVDDVLNVLRLNFTPCPFDHLLLHRFGIAAASIDAATLKHHGLDLPTDVVDWRKHGDRLVDMFRDPAVSGPILANAAEERALLLELYEQEGLTSTTASTGAIVDIGHEGSLQKGLRDLLGAPTLAGYYFATYSNIEDAIPDCAERTAAFLVNRLDRNAQRHSYIDHILMFEVVFLNDQGSFIRVQRNGDRLVPEFLDVSGERPRIELIKAAHRGSVAFCRDIGAAFGGLALSFQLTGKDATAGYRAMLGSPSLEDAKLFQGIGFENKYSGRNRSWIIPPAKDDAAGTAIWQQGFKRLNSAERRRRAYGFLGWRRLMTPFVAHFVNRIGGEKEAAKYRSDPIAYVEQLSNPVYVAIFKILYAGGAGKP